MTQLVKIALILMPFFTIYGKGMAQSDQANLKLKGIYVYQFAKNVDWPKEFKTGDFVIGVLGDKEMFDQLNASYANKTIGSQAIKVSYFESISEVAKCHILYVGSKLSSKVSEINSKMHKYKTLIVTDGSNLLSTGSVINFVVKDSKIAFEISKKNADKLDLVIGQTLEKLAVNS